MRLARRCRHTRNFEARYVQKVGRVVILSWSGAWSEGGQQHSFIGREVTEQKLVAKLRPSLKVLFTSGFTENAFTHHGNLEAGVRCRNPMPTPTSPAWSARLSAANPTSRRRCGN
jgi:hypothetical protein